MKAHLFALLSSLALSDCSRATPLIIDITTKETGIAYAINNKPMTLSQVEAFLRNATEIFGDVDPILIRPDDRTSFVTVLDMLNRCKDSGVKLFEVFAIADSPGGRRVRRSLSGTAENVKQDALATTAPDPSK